MFQQIAEMKCVISVPGAPPVFYIQCQGKRCREEYRFSKSLPGTCTQQWKCQGCGSVIEIAARA